ncbi:Hexosyltransferase [Psidium guajava]|nr:Hexosyltransferase [Psidium guajava]
MSEICVQTAFHFGHCQQTKWRLLTFRLVPSNKLKMGAITFCTPVQ